MRLNHTKLLLTGLLLALAPSALASTTWYVNGISGSDNNKCTSPTTACRTIGHAISLASSGDSIMVAAATYTEHLTIGISLRVIGSGSPTTIIEGNSIGTVITISSANAQITLSNITIRKGINIQGGGIYNNGTLTINYNTVSGNHARSQGGGIYNNGTLTVNYSTVSGNGVDSPYGGCGGGIYNSSSGRLTINASTISGNGVGSFFVVHGGGICNASSGSVTINNSTVSGNTVGCSSSFTRACYAASGGGISNGGSLVVNNSTVSSNNAREDRENFVPEGGGIYNGGTASAQNSILADNRVIQTGNHNLNSPENCYGPVYSHGYTLSSDGTCYFDLKNTDPLLGPLQNNGGPTDTMALLPGSPAIDAGNPSGCRDSQGNLLTTDQRGYPRHDPEDTSGCDIGAYERQSD